MNITVIIINIIVYMLISYTVYADNNKISLIIKVEPQVRTCMLGIDFNIDVIIRNNSSTSVKLLKPLSSSLNIGRVVDNNDVDLGKVPIIVNHTGIFPSNYVTLEPGQAVSNTVALANLIGPPTEEGVYIYKLIYRSYGRDVPQIECNAGIFRVKYITPSGDSYAAWLLFKNRKSKTNGLPITSVLTEIIDKYPDTIYGTEASKILRRKHLPE